VASVGAGTRAVAVEAEAATMVTEAAGTRAARHAVTRGVRVHAAGRVASRAARKSAEAAVGVTIRATTRANDE